jgi:CelD/BcsL family acetyltransferase involved in cellulose biosynthesis
MTLLSSPDNEEAVRAALAAWLIEHASYREHAWDVLKLDGVAASDRGLAAFIELLSAAGCAQHRSCDPSCWRLPLPSTWEAFLACASKNRRKNIRRLQRQVTETPGLKVHRAQNAVEFETGMRVLTDLHQRRQASQGKPGCFASAAFDGFLRESGERLLQRGMLELWWLEIEGRPIASEIDLVDGDTVYGYQGGVDPQALDQSPGNLLLTVILQQAIESGRRAYDFLRGDELYKQHWNAAPVELLRYRVAANRAGSQLRHGVWTVGSTVKSWVKGGMSLAGLH